MSSLRLNETFIITALCIVLYSTSGHDTKALMNNRGPRHKRSKIERQINRDVIWCVIALFLMCLMCSIGKCDVIRGRDAM